jgi:RNA polymerase sigma-70 factor, ECF subfamily
MSTPGSQVTQLLHAWSEGDEGALDQLVPLVYEELYRLARGFMANERPGHTLQATALVNEAYLRLVRSEFDDFQDRAHFFAVSARVMRRILVDWARSRQAQKRGNDVQLFELEENFAGRSNDDLVAIDDALKALADFDQRKCQVVELRYFGGLSIRETAQVLTVSEETIRRDWNIAKAWLRQELSSGASSGG